MKWMVARRIVLSSLVLGGFPNEPETFRSFFKLNGMTLRVLKLSHFSGAMSLLTRSIASHCMILETLSLEECNLAAPLADVLNKTKTIKEVRFQSKRRKMLKRSLFEKVTCPSVVKLALLDPLLSEDADVVARAFPNVEDFELHCVEPGPLAKQLSAWPNIVTLRLSSVSTIDTETVDVIATHVHASLKRIVCLDTSWRSAALLETLLTRCPNITSVSIICGNHPAGASIITTIAMTCGVRLEELNVGGRIVADSDVEALAKHCPNLRVLGMACLGKCSNYEVLLRECTQLEKLRVTPHVRTFYTTKKVLRRTTNNLKLLASIATHCKNLALLSYNVSVVSEPTLSALLKCTQLRVFETTCAKANELSGKLRGVKVQYCSESSFMRAEGHF